MDEPTATTEAAAAATPAAGSLGPEARSTIGVNVSWYEIVVGLSGLTRETRDARLDAIAATGVTWVRTDLQRDWIERANLAEPDWASFQDIVDATAARGLRLVFVVNGSAAYGGTVEAPHAPCREESRASYRDFFLGALARFNGRGIYWEIGNEPQHEGFYRMNGVGCVPEDRAQSYLALALATGSAAKAAYPKETLIGPGLASMFGQATSSAGDMPFLDTLFRGGLLGAIDMVSVHPYRQIDRAPDVGPENMGADFARMQAMMPQGKRVPVLAGEFGIASIPSWGIDEARQAQLVTRFFLSTQLARTPLSIWYDWRERTDIPAASHPNVLMELYAGLTRQNDKPKPAWFAARTFTDLVGGFGFERRIDTGNANDHVLVFRRAGEARVVAWTTGASRTAKLDLTSVGVASWTSVDHVGNPGAVSASGNKTSLTLSRDPRFLFSTAGSAPCKLEAPRDHDAYVIPSAYCLMLDRPADPGAQHWFGRSRRELLTTIFASSELRAHEPVVASPPNVAENQRFVEMLYRRLLRRDADAPGRAGWVGQMCTRSGQSSCMTRAQVFEAFVATPEFASKHPFLVR